MQSTMTPEERREIARRAAETRRINIEARRVLARERAKSAPVIVRKAKPARPALNIAALLSQPDDLAAWRAEIERRTQEAARAARKRGSLPVVDLTEHHPRGAVPEPVLAYLRREADPRFREVVNRKADEIRKAAKRHRETAEELEAKGARARADEHLAEAEVLESEAEELEGALNAA